jgi:hypothetical protein
MKPIIRFLGTAALLAGRGAGAQEQLKRNQVAPTNLDKFLDPNQINLGDGSNVQEIRNYIFPTTANLEFGEVSLNGESKINKKTPSLSFSNADYFGDVVGGQMHGKGVLILTNGERYDGEFRNGKKHGKGVLSWADGENYIGEFRNGKKHGKGVLTWADGNKYEGEFQDDKKHGKGVLSWADGDKYEGEFQDDKKHGKGVLILADGEIYDGEFKNGKKHGKGVLSWADGNKYEGEFQDGKEHGKGVFTWVNGGKYEGYFENNQLHGKGVFTWVNGDKYEGEFRDGKKHGKGVLILADGESYDGEFQDDKKHGKGVLTWADGNKYEGEFRDGKKHGKGLLTEVNGNRYEGYFESNQLYEKGVLTLVDGDKYEGEFKNDKKHGKDSLSFTDGMIFSAIVLIFLVNRIHNQLHNQRRAEDVPTNKKGFRPEEEARKAVYGYAKNISELEFDLESLEPQQKEGLLLLAIERAGEIFESISQTNYSQILEVITNQTGYVTTANLKLVAKLGEKTIGEITKYPLEISAEKENINKTPKEFLASSENQISELTDKFLTSVVNGFLTYIPECPQKEELNTFLKNGLKNTHSYENIQTVRTLNGLTIEKNFVYDVALQNGVLHPILNREKLEEILQIFRQSVRDYHKEVHSQVYEEKSKITAGELIEELVAKIEQDSANNLSRATEFASTSSSAPETSTTVSSVNILALKTHSNERNDSFN